MSRINDALKRASRAQQKNLPRGRPPLPLVARKPGNAISWILPGVIGVLIFAAFLFTGLALATRTATKAAGEPKALVAQLVKPVAIPAPAARPAPAPPPPSPSPPEPKLQGIVYAPTQPWAIVDGLAVHVGDRLGEFRVKAISSRAVTLEKTDGSQKKLRLSN
jgi:hypothetical protein